MEEKTNGNTADSEKITLEKFAEEVRQMRSMPLLAATNLTEDELRTKYGEYVYDRLRSLCNRVFFDGESFRK